MIRLICTNCHAVLEMDEAFAGGACRCQHCGTIQTVPSHLKQQQSAAGGKTLYQQQRREDVPGAGTGLDELANIVASSGLAGSGLRSGRLAGKPPPAKAKPRATAKGGPPAAEPAPAPAPPRRTTLLLGSAAAVILLLISLVVALLMRPTGATTASIDPADAATTASIPAGAMAPNFCGIPLSGNTVIYVLDRGDSTREPFGHLKEAFYRSIETLGTDRRFQVVFWSNGTEWAYPAGVPTYATRENVQATKRAMNELYAFGQTEVSSALTKAMAGNPSEVVIATAKAWQLEDDFIDTVLRIRGQSDARIHTVAIGGSGNNPVLRLVAQKTAGRHIELSPSDLAAHAQ